MKQKIQISFLMLLLFACLVSAQTQPKSGRLKDGRAYRIDAQGMKIIDQLAALEVESREQKERIQELEDEIENNQKTINKLKSSPACSAETKIKETALLEDAQSVSLKKNSRQDSKNTEPPSCNELVSSLSLKVARLEDEKKQWQKTGSQVLTKKIASEQEKELELTSLREETRALKKEIIEKEAGYRKAINQEVENSRQKEEQFKRSIKESEELLSSLKNRHADDRNLSEKRCSEQLALREKKYQSDLSRIEELKEASCQKVIAAQVESGKSKEDELKRQRKEREDLISSLKSSYDDELDLREKRCGEKLAVKEKEYQQELSRIQNVKQEQLVQCESALSREKLSLKSGNSSFEGKLSSLQEQLESKNSELIRRRRDLELAQSKVSLLEQEKEKQNQEIASAQKDQRRASLSSSSRIVVNTSSEQKLALSNHGNDSLILINLKKEIQAELQGIDKKVLQRKTLYDSLKGKSKGISVKMQTLTTSDGQSLDSLRVGAKAVIDETAAYRVRKGVAEIEKLLDDDIAVLKRLSR